MIIIVKYVMCMIKNVINMNVINVMMMKFMYVILTTQFIITNNADVTNKKNTVAKLQKNTVTLTKN